jgi:hypothetical protein
VGLCALLLICQVGATEVHWSLSATVARVDSRWQEFDDNGRRLLTENGPLTGPSLAAAHYAGPWTLVAHAAQLHGERAYSGETSLGQAVSTGVSLQRHQLGVTLQYQWTPWLTSALQLEHLVTDRVIASAGTAAAGYPEQFRWLLASAGVIAQWPLAHTRIQGSAWWGQGAQATMRLSLPGRDPGQLPLGRLTQSAFELAWVVPVSKESRIYVQTGWQGTDIAAGENTVITRSSVPVALARQPQTRILHRPLAIGLEVQF